MMYIKLTNAKLVVLVDDEDYPWISTYTWQYNKYVTRMDGTGKERTSIYLHKQIAITHNLIKTIDSIVDHKNRNTLDNQKHNLRPCTKAQNQANSSKSLGKSSQFKGVCWDSGRRKWMASIRVDRIMKNLGRFEIEQDAAIAYNNAAREYFGEYANLNAI